MNKRKYSLLVFLIFPIIIPPVFAQTIQPPYDSNYVFLDLGSVPGVPPSYGGLTLDINDLNKLLIGGSANTAGGLIYSIDVVRDGNDHIIGFSGIAVPVIAGGFNNGGLAYGPGDVLFYSRYIINELGQVEPGSAVTNKIIPLTPLGVAVSTGGLNFVPPGFPSAGNLKINSWSGGQWYDVTLTPDGGGTFDINTIVNIPASTLPGGPEGFIWVPPGSPDFPDPSMLVSEWSAGNIAAYEIDGNSDPIIATRQTFMSGLSGAEGAFIDPLTGDFMFSTFGGGDRVVIVQGFLPPPPPPPPTVVGGELLPIDTTALLLVAVQSPTLWWISGLLSAVGVGAFLFTRNPNNTRNVKVILQDYLDKFVKTD